MATGTARGGALRWARGALIALCAVLAVLVHHETAAAAVSSMPSAMRSSLHATPGMTSSSHAAMPMDTSADRTEVLSAYPAADPAGYGACSTTGMHCSTTSIDTVKLTVPAQGHVEHGPSPDEAAAGRTPARAVGRAPPDLVVLSQLRI